MYRYSAENKHEPNSSDKQHKYTDLRCTTTQQSGAIMLETSTSSSVNESTSILEPGIVRKLYITEKDDDGERNFNGDSRDDCAVKMDVLWTENGHVTTVLRHTEEL